MLGQIALSPVWQLGFILLPADTAPVFYGVALRLGAALALGPIGFCWGWRSGLWRRLLPSVRRYSGLWWLAGLGSLGMLDVGLVALSSRGTAPEVAGFLLETHPLFSLFSFRLLERLGVLRTRQGFWLPLLSCPAAMLGVYLAVMSLDGDLGASALTGVSWASVLLGLGAGVLGTLVGFQGLYLSRVMGDFAGDTGMIRVRDLAPAVMLLGSVLALPASLLGLAVSLLTGEVWSSHLFLATLPFGMLRSLQPVFFICAIAMGARGSLLLLYCNAFAGFGLLACLGLLAVERPDVLLMGGALVVLACMAGNGGARLLRGFVSKCGTALRVVRD